MDILIREAVKEDLKDVLSLYGDETLDNGDVLEEDKAMLVFENMKTYPFYKLYVAEVDCKIIGTYTLCIMENMIHKGKSSAVVESVAVEKEYRSQGIGKIMMSHAIQQCENNNCYKMALSSNVKRERAHEFYEKQGFYLYGYGFATNINSQV